MQQTKLTNVKQPELEKELQPIKEKKLTLVDTPITQKQILQIFQRTPREHIHERPGKGGGNWTYVTGVYVKKVLNYTFGWLWDYQIIDKGKEGDQVWVQGRLTIRNEKLEPIIIKEQFGSADVKFKRGTKVLLDYGNDLKAAATDALKKCASEIGIASDIYGKNEFMEIGVEHKSNQPTKAQPVKPQSNVNYILKLKAELNKRGAESLTEAIKIYNDITGENIKGMPTGQNRAKEMLFALLNSPSKK